MMIKDSRDKMCFSFPAIKKTANQLTHSFGKVAFILIKSNLLARKP